MSKGKMKMKNIIGTITILVGLIFTQASVQAQVTFNGHGEQEFDRYVNRYDRFPVVEESHPRYTRFADKDELTIPACQNWTDNREAFLDCYLNNSGTNFVVDESSHDILFMPAQYWGFCELNTDIYTCQL